MSAITTCDDCCNILISLSEEGRNEVYCPHCDVGECAQGDCNGDWDECVCGMKLCTVYPFSRCPTCITGEPIPAPRKPDELH